MPEGTQLGFTSEVTPSPSPVAVATGEAEALVGGVGALKLEGGEDRDGENGERPVSEAEDVKDVASTEGEESGTATAVTGGAPCVPGGGAVSGEKAAEESEADKAWRGQQEWMEEEEKEVVKEGDREEEGGNGVQQVGGKVEKRGKFAYPQRPGEPDCTYYLKTGYCAFGANCKFNHPHSENRIHVVKSTESLEKSQVKEKEKEESSGSVGQILCKYYLTTEGCKYGVNCRYRHGREKSEADPELNILGLPMRPGEKGCPFYMRTGSCKYGTNCRFHHPDPTAVGEPVSVSGYHDNGSSRQHAFGVSQAPSASWGLQNCSNQLVSFADSSPSSVPAVLLPHQLHQNPEWNGHQAPNSLHSPEGNKKYPSGQMTFKQTANMNGHSGQVRTEVYPQRPGQPDCQFYMENGSCKYKSACRFHHPKDRLATPSMCLLSPMGLPLRPDQPVCAYYSRYGICKFGPNCRFNHPMDQASSKVHHQTAGSNP